MVNPAPCSLRLWIPEAELDIARSPRLLGHILRNFTHVTTMIHTFNIYTRGSCQISRDRSRDFQSGASHQPNTSFDAEFHVGRRGIHFWTIFSSYIAKTTFWGSKKIQNSWICGGCVLTLTASRRLISPLKMMDLCSKTLFLVPETTINTFLVKYAIE